ncbi:hypothetical protein [Mesorhizobium sp. M0047]|uniref:hypothetical protein n=1 Tax=Mesorhizobium sp. M0047 TaxID=2956859 RepID=UPI00333C4008
MNADIAPMIVPVEFPELRALAWNRDPARSIPAGEAFALFERNWRFVDQKRLSTREKLLIQTVADKFGHGILLTTV